MLRTLYFVLALLSALIGMLSTLAGFCYFVYSMSAGGMTLEQAMHHSTAVGMFVSAGSLIGWILFSYLFVQEDERLENDPGNHP